MGIIINNDPKVTQDLRVSFPMSCVIHSKNGLPISWIKYTYLPTFGHFNEPQHAKLNVSPQICCPCRDTQGTPA